MDNSALNDSQLWDAFLSGDNQAMSGIYKKYYKVLYAYGIKIIPNGEWVKDAIQDLFVKLHLNREQLKPTSHLHSYLLLALKRKLYDMFKSAESFEELSFDLLSDELVTNDFLLKNDEDLKKKEKLEKALSTLTSKQQEVLYLRFVNELSVEDISKFLDINYQSAKNFIYRTIIKLRASYLSLDK